MGRNRHDRAGAVFHEHEIGQIDGDRLLGERVETERTGEDALLLHLHVAAPRMADPLHPLGELLHRALLRRAFRKLQGQGMFGGQGNEGGAVDGILAGGEDGEVTLPAHQREADLGADGFPDPVALHGQHLVRPPLEFVASRQQILGVGRDAEEPLGQLAHDHLVLATPTATVHHLLVGQNGLATAAPVDRRVPLVRQAALEHLQEEHLLPAIVARIGRRQLTGPVVAEAHLLELRPHVVDVLHGPPGGMDLVGDGGVLRGQAKGVPAHGMKHVESAHALVARDHVSDGVVPHVAHVYPARRIGKHLQQIILGQVRGLVHSKALESLPLRLPSLLDIPELVLLCHGSGRSLSLSPLASATWSSTPLMKAEEPSDP